MRRLKNREVVFAFVLKVAAVLLLCMCCWSHVLSATRPSIVGDILNTSGKPIADATVVVYHAGPVTGYSLFCPSCYADCGKQAMTNSKGTFSFHHLSPGLWFELLATKNGYEPKFIKRVVPGSAMPVTATLDVWPEIIAPNRVFRGRVVDSHGIPQDNAVVQPVGALWRAKPGAPIYGGPVPGLDPIAVTSKDGVFRVGFRRAKHGQQDFFASFGVSGPPSKILVSVEARGMAEVFSVIPAGLERPKIHVTEGATVRGRLVQNGRPVGGAEIGLIGYPRGGWGPNFKASGSPYQEIRIGTRPDGTFEIDNVPVPGNWYVYAKMESVATRGATGIIACATKRNGEIVNIRDLKLKPAYHLRGRVVLSDGKPIAKGMRVTISAKKAWDSQTASLPPSGRFEFVGLAAGKYSIFASVKGYSRRPMRPVSFKTKRGRTLTYTPPPPPVSIEHDVDHFVLTLRPDVSPSAKIAVPNKAHHRWPLPRGLHIHRAFAMRAVNGAGTQSVAQSSGVETRGSFSAFDAHSGWCWRFPIFLVRCSRDSLFKDHSSRFQLSSSLGLFR